MLHSLVLKLYCQELHTIQMSTRFDPWHGGQGACAYKLLQRPQQYTKKQSMHRLQRSTNQRHMHPASHLTHPHPLHQHRLLCLLPCRPHCQCMSHCPLQQSAFHRAASRLHCFQSTPQLTQVLWCHQHSSRLEPTLPVTQQ